MTALQLLLATLLAHSSAQDPWFQARALTESCETGTGWREQVAGSWVAVCGDDEGNEVYRPAMPSGPVEITPWEVCAAHADLTAPEGTEAHFEAYQACFSVLVSRDN